LWIETVPHEQHYTLTTSLLHPASAMLQTADAVVVHRILGTDIKGNRAAIRPTRAEA
jgi:hypothetical protein